MQTNETETLKRIHECAVKEFSKKGFRGASLRSIVKNAGVTTGAFYGYYKSKEELFEALVDTQAQHMMNLFFSSHDKFIKIPKEEQPKHMGEIGSQCSLEIIEYAYDNADVCKLLLCSAEGTKYENYIHQMVEKEIKSTERFADVLRELGHDTKKFDPYFEHIIVSGMISSMFELVIHDVPKERAIKLAKELHDFYTAGWSKIMGL